MVRVEFVYNKKMDKTVIYIWKAMQLVDVRELDGIVSTEFQKKHTKEIQGEPRWG